jgi:hypothetical protein
MGVCSEAVESSTLMLGQMRSQDGVFAIHRPLLL